MSADTFFFSCVRNNEHNYFSLGQDMEKGQNKCGVQTFTMNTSFSLGICIADSIRRPEWYHSLLRDQGALVVSSFGIRKKRGCYRRHTIGARVLTIIMYSCCQTILRRWPLNLCFKCCKLQLHPARGVRRTIRPTCVRVDMDSFSEIWFHSRTHFA